MTSRAGLPRSPTKTRSRTFFSRYRPVFPKRGVRRNLAPPPSWQRIKPCVTVKGVTLGRLETHGSVRNLLAFRRRAPLDLS
jgi:hypothetical protein